jgi:hypothetical protein
LKKSPQSGRWFSLVDRCARGTLAVWTLLALELAVVAAFGYRQFASVWELEYGALWLSPSALVLATGFGLAGAGVFALAERGHEREPRAALALFALVFGGVLGWGVGGGRHLSELSQRLGLRWSPR